MGFWRRESQTPSFAVCGLLLWGMIGAAPAIAAPADLARAKALFREGRALYQAGDYPEAIDRFNAAAQIQPSPILSFNIGRCYHKQGDAARAIAAYQRYLQGKPGAANYQQVEGWIAELQEQQQQEPVDPYEELVDSATPASQPASAPALQAPEEPRTDTAAPVAEDPPHEAALAPSGSGPRAQGAAPAPGGQLPQRSPSAQEGPFYKQWWFWVACAGGAVIAGFIIATAASSPDAPAPSTSRSALQFSF